MVYYKIKNVPDEVCKDCPQNYDNECRAFLVAEAGSAEYVQRITLNQKGSFQNCEYRPPYPGEKYVPHGEIAVKVK